MTPCSKFRLSCLPLLAAPLMLVALSSCASDSGGAINGQRALSPEEQRLQATETKITEVSRRMNALEAQQNGNGGDEMRNLRGQVEQLRYDVDQMQKSQAQINDIDQRLRRLEAGGAAPAGDPNAAPGAVYNTPGATPGAPVGPSAYSAQGAPARPFAPAPATPVSASASADEEALYMRSFDQLKASKYDDAIGGFHSMVAKYPQGNYADNAWYWMGKSYYIKRDYPNALKSFQTVLTGFPASPKVPDALLDIGSIHQDQQQKDQARAAFQKILTSYPASSAAAQARTRIAQLK